MTRGTRIRRAAICLLLAIPLATACTGGGTGSHGRPSVAPNTTAPPTPSTGGTHHVELHVVSQGSGKLAIDYSVGAGQENEKLVENVTSPWSVSADAPEDLPLIDLGALSSEHVGVSCVIILDGSVVDQRSNVGSAICHWAA